jgi:starch phosphorylase
LTIGTLDGANVEIREAVGDEHFFLFGLQAHEIEPTRSSYDPGAIIAADPDFSRVMKMLEEGCFNKGEPGIFNPVFASVRSPSDAWMTAADFRSYVDAQQAVANAYQETEAWTRSSIQNTAASGRFSSDRTIREYSTDIWHI